MRWSFFIRLFLESYLQMCIAFGIKVHDLRFNSISARLNSYSSLMFGIGLCLAPFAVIAFLYSNYDKFLNQEFNEKYGEFLSRVRY